MPTKYRITSEKPAMIREYIMLDGTLYVVPGIMPAKKKRSNASKKSNWPRIMSSEPTVQPVIIAFLISLSNLA